VNLKELKAEMVEVTVLKEGQSDYMLLYSVQ